ncbi:MULTISPECIES: 3-keto-5-aminohexanoate cleavage protein [Halomonas]|uniref:3-keto-5-aminohexanoate cleavage protein n=1 Tax=Halomonas TaxID=2745 RepID=UPI001C96112B|nr:MULTISPECIES: 3-keto-5-aminohexanoate cleavage protein [Halomonas]MBY6208644.1 3-keto-5-aminohexanoate cleavage protein [Halomonas sp. DP3Y7-2]MBY6227115.1 3-keto-5-aminohexanoate cleavage protein [Halomonas sp. DP3Y7-1]MCA0915136.1 3-keto-5-aminohexanoate cleavage protein [Halomonas denitrificans]
MTSPCLLMVAPNGARRTRVDHPQIPLTPEALAADALACRDAGAAMVHLHVREPDGRHLLDVAAYRDALGMIRAAVGDDMVLQVTSEAGGRYDPQAQRKLLEELRPESVSVAVRELFGDPREVAASGAVCRNLQAEGGSVQYILYSVEDLLHFNQLRDTGVLPSGKSFLLFVLGRYETPPVADPARLPEFLEALTPGDRWAVCAFGPTEAECMGLAAAHGGHARVGFENNLWRPDGTLVKDNAELVRLTRERIEASGRSIMKPRQVREFLGLPLVRSGRLA